METSAEHVASAYGKRERDAERIVALLDGGDNEEANEARDWLLADEGYEDVTDYLAEAYALEVTCGFGQPLEITLTTGGPGEWIEAKLDDDRDVASAEFWSVWGSDRARTSLSSTSALYRIAEYYAESFKS